MTLRQRADSGWVGASVGIEVVGDRVGASVGYEVVGNRVGVSDGAEVVGDRVGDRDGARVGPVVGRADGNPVGDPDGNTVGCGVGEGVGVLDGESVGYMVGAGEGGAVGPVQAQYSRFWASVAVVQSPCVWYCAQLSSVRSQPAQAKLKLSSESPVEQCSWSAATPQPQ